MFVRSIQVLRGLAAVAVVLFHVSIWENKKLGVQLMPGCFQLGDVGVDLFFVISGFIMVYIQPARISSGKDYARFLIHRFSRVFPPYWLVLLVLLPIWLKAPQLFNNYQHNHVDLVRSVLLLPQDYMPLLSVGWTLIHEVYFYFAVSVALLFGARGRWVYGTVWFATVIAVFWFFDGRGLEQSRVLQVVFSPFSLTFLLGYFVGLLQQRLRAAPVVLGFGLLTCAAVVWLWAAPRVANGVYPDNNSLARFLALGLPCSLAVASAIVLERHLPAFMLKLQWLGDRSYAIYLVHLPLVSGIYGVAARYHINSSWMVVGIAVMCVTGCLATASLFHDYLEMRAITKCRRFLESQFGIATPASRAVRPATAS